MDTRKFLDLAGLQTFYDQLRLYYANTDLVPGRVGLADKASKLANPVNVTFKSGDVELGKLTNFDGSEDKVVTLALPDTGVLDVKVDGTSVVTDGIANIDMAGTLEPYQKTADADAKYVVKEGYVAYSQAEKTKLAGIADGAEVNVLEAVEVKNEAIVTMDGKKAVIDLGAFAKKEDIAAVLKFKGVRDTEAEIKAIVDPSVGDVYLCRADNSEYVCVAVAGGVGTWEKLGTVVDLSGYYTKTEVDAKIEDAVKAAERALDDLDDKKQDKLTAGAGIVIENNTITYDPDELATVLYVDDSITATMLYIDQQDASEHAGRVAGDNLLDAKKVDKVIESEGNKALIFNEVDGGGAKFENADGTASFVGVNADTNGGIGAQIYDIDVAANKGTKLDVTKNGIFYTVGDDSALPAAQRDVADNELLTKKTANVLVDVEKARAEAAEAALAADLADEVARAESKEAELAAADIVLQNNIDLEVENRNEAIDYAFNSDIHVIEEHEILKMFGDTVEVASADDFTAKLNSVKPGSTIIPAGDLEYSDRPNIGNDLVIDLN